MTKIFLLIFMLALLSCSRTARHSETKTTDSLTTQTTAVNEYELASVYRKLDSDSLLLDKGDLMKLLDIRVNGTRINETEYVGGDCGGKFIQRVLATDTLTIDKYDCGDYGFGNMEFITKGDSLLYVRTYKTEWSPDDTGNQFNVSETIYEFSPARATKRTRAKSIKGLKDFRINDRPFEETRVPGQTEYFEFKKELKELALREKLDK